MTLKEKIDDALFYIEPKESITKCVQIADEFAIGFAEWCLSSGIYHQLIRTQKINKELLEIYKKEEQL